MMIMVMVMMLKGLVQPIFCLLVFRFLTFFVPAKRNSSPSCDSYHRVCLCPCTRYHVIRCHDMLVRAFVDAFKQAGVQVEVEPQYRKEEYHCDPDGDIYGLRPGKKVAFDVSDVDHGNSVLGIAHIFAQDGLNDAA